MDYLPVFFDLRGRLALVVGGGAAAAAKARRLADAGAAVTMIAPEVADAALALLEAGRVALARRPFADADVRGQALVVAASGEDTLDAGVAAAARAHGVPVNVVDRAELSNFIFPAIVDRGEVVVGVSTGGAAPVLAQQLRARIERALPERVGELAAVARAFRPTVAALIPDYDERRRFWEQVFAGAIAAAVLAGNLPKARERMMRALDRARRHPPAGRSPAAHPANGVEAAR
jgi:uroporphyrin-III C-methyltransferase/precorrin-2 dehydrogenase/sirohydrochlorin ferrochelatase